MNSNSVEVGNKTQEETAGKSKQKITERSSMWTLSMSTKNKSKEVAEKLQKMKI